MEENQTGENSSKWLLFFIGASPTLLVIILTLTDRSGWSPVTAFFSTAAYFVLGSIIALVILRRNKEKKKETPPIVTGIITGIITSAIFTGVSCTGVLS